jgi:hypothetical protein
MDALASLFGTAWIVAAWVYEAFGGLFKFFEKPLTVFDGVLLAYFIYRIVQSLERTTLRVFGLLGDSTDRIENRIKALEDRHIT